MLNFDKLDTASKALAASFRTAVPFEHVVIDDFCETAALERLVLALPDPAAGAVNLSRDYMFAKNKYEKSGIKDLSPEFADLYADLTGARFQVFLRTLTGEAVFVDPEFHGGGIHQGGEKSFLDMHVDFNTHPLQKTWFRNLNILLYLNRDWQPEYRGELKIRHREQADSTVRIEPLFNRCVIMFTRDYTVHGYDTINFPAGTYRRSIAAYAYTLTDADQEHRTTVWLPEQGGAAKKAIGRHWPVLVRVKNALFGSATAKNK